ncbi:MAG: hypothetical protein K8M05_05475 [Deltaproteobacteria bacterium]|nr:hypothetical protein [Kofleriaceae bacterium]
MRAVLLLGVLTWITSSLVAGCGGGNSCEEAIANAAKLYGIGGSSYGAQRAKAVQTCKDEKWSEKLRACAVAARTKGELDACEKYKNAEAGGGGAEEYVQKSKRSEAELNLESIKRSLKAHYAEMAMFPTGSAPLTPATACCAHSPDRKCPPNRSDWQGVAVWDSLDFEMSEPSYFQYSYESNDGKSAVARAVGDLDCDGMTITFELRCEAPDGEVSCTLTKPDRAD